MLIKSWEKTKGKKVNYIYLHDNEFVIGEHYGSGHTDNAGSCSIEKFIEGRFQSLVKQNFGEDVLQEIFSLIKINKHKKL